MRVSEGEVINIHTMRVSEGEVINTQLIFRVTNPKVALKK
jgi:hypothetical protein